MTRPRALRRLVADQADDEGLWGQAETAMEAYVQAALRELHAAVEAERDLVRLIRSSVEVAVDFDHWWDDRAHILRLCDKALADEAPAGATSPSDERGDLAEKDMPVSAGMTREMMLNDVECWSREAARLCAENGNLSYEVNSLRKQLCEMYDAAAVPPAGAGERERALEDAAQLVEREAAYLRGLQCGAGTLEGKFNLGLKAVTLEESAQRIRRLAASPRPTEENRDE